MPSNRSLSFEGAINFRDLGGYPAGPGRATRWHRVYRSDSLSDLTDADVAQLDRLDIYGLCDYRLPDEADKKPDRLPTGHDIQVINPGFQSKNIDQMLDQIGAGAITPEEIREQVVEHYRLFAQHHMADYAPFFRMILEADGRPVLIHCTSGKDRTGWGSALTLLAAGCDDAVVADDYALTNEFRRNVAFLFPDGASTEAMEMLTSAQPIYIETALSELRRLYGPGDGWMEVLGLDRAERIQLRTLLSLSTG